MIINHVPQLLEKKFDGKPNLLQVQKETGLNYGTVTSWAKDRVDRFDKPVLEAWCKYFKCQPGDLFSYQE